MDAGWWATASLGLLKSRDQELEGPRPPPLTPSQEPHGESGFLASICTDPELHHQQRHLQLSQGLQGYYRNCTLQRSCSQAWEVQVQLHTKEHTVGAPWEANFGLSVRFPTMT